MLTNKGEEMLQKGAEIHQNTLIQKYKEYDLGQEFAIEDAENENDILIFDIIDLTFKTDGVDDKIYLTITSADTGETIFYGRNMWLRTAPVLLLTSKIVAIDDCGVNGSMNFIIKTSHWIRKKI
jgi:hypothetical protein